MAIYKFQTESCVLCRRVEAFLESNNIPHENFNVENDKLLQEKYKVYTVPTVLKFDEEGNEIFRMEGLDPKKLQELVEGEVKND